MNTIAPLIGKYMRLLLAIACLLIAMPLIQGEPSENSKQRAEERYPQVFRTFMPEAGPSAFAVQLSPNLGLCYDPLRGGVNQIWRGRVDLTPTNLAKINQVAMVPEAVFYEERLVQPLHLGAIDAPVERRFKGYRYEKDVVIFEYTINGHLISESLRMTSDGSSVERIFRLPKDGGEAFLPVEPQSKSKVSIEGGSEQSSGLWTFPAGGEIRMFIRPRDVIISHLPVKRRTSSPLAHSCS